MIRDRSTPRVEPKPATRGIGASAREGRAQCGPPPDTRAFKPHVTLARLKHSNADAVARFLIAVTARYRSEPFFVGATLLMSSRPGVGGGPYGIEERFPMRGMGFLADESEGDAELVRRSFRRSSPRPYLSPPGAPEPPALRRSAPARKFRGCAAAAALAHPRETCSMLRPMTGRIALHRFAPENTGHLRAPEQSRLSGIFGMSPAANPTTRNRPCQLSARTSGSDASPPMQS